MKRGDIRAYKKKRFGRCKSRASTVLNAKKNAIIFF
jgi:hypothetical protein